MRRNSNKFFQQMKRAVVGRDTWNRAAPERANSRAVNLFEMMSMNRDKGVFAAEYSDEQGRFEIVLGDVIVDNMTADWFGMGVSPAMIRDALLQAQGADILLRIDSPGGDVFAGRNIEQQLRDHSGHVYASVDGFCGSAATLPLLAADMSRINPGGFVMIHNATTYGWGDHHDMRFTADLLERTRDSIAATYNHATGISAAELADLMDAETWYIGQEAVDAGFVHELAGSETDFMEDRARWNVSAFHNVPQAVRNFCKGDQCCAAGGPAAEVAQRETDAAAAAVVAAGQHAPAVQASESPPISPGVSAVVPVSTSLSPVDKLRLLLEMNCGASR